MTYLLLLAGAQLATAQQSSLRGTVVSAETGQPLSFSIVTLHPDGGRQFTDGAGTFVFAGPKPGAYLLSVRQIGYTPLDTQIVVGKDTVTTVRTALRHLAIELPPVTVTARECTDPGAPDPAAQPALAAFFGQLQESARRVQLLADSYPFHFRLEQTLRDVNRRGDSLRAVVRTLDLRSDNEPPYEPGRVVRPAWAPWQSALLVRTMTLDEFANAAFVKNHCFQLAGRDTIEGETLVRIDFEPATRLPWADMAGSVYLDSLTYHVRFTETSLTHPERSELADIKAMTTRTRFDEIGPGIPLQQYLRAVTTFRFGGRLSSVETQRLLEVRFNNRSVPLKN